MEVVEDYVTPSGKEEVKQKRKKEKSNNKKEKNNKKEEPRQTDEEVNEEYRKREILASVALLDGLKSYVGKDISAEQVRKMNKKELDSIFKLYQEKSGQELAVDSMGLIVEGMVKGLSFFLKFDDDELLKKDLMENKLLRRTIGRRASTVTEKYGDFVAILKTAFDVAKHVVSNPFGNVAKDEVKEETIASSN